MTKLELAHIELGNFLYTVSADTFVDFNEAVKEARENWHIINDEFKALKKEQND